MSAILDFLHAWLGGKLPDDHTLGGIPAFWVARTGKGFQIAAGLLVVFDLLTAKRLADWASRASTRAAQRIMLVQYFEQYKKIDNDLVLRHRAMTGKYSIPVVVSLKQSPPDRVPGGVRLTLDEYRDFHRRIIEQAEREHPCKESHGRWPCGEQQTYVQRSAEELAAEQLPPAERALFASVDIHRVTKVNRRIAALIQLLATGAVIPVLLIATSLKDENAILAYFLIAPSLGVIALIVASISDDTHGRLPLRLRAVWHRRQKWVADRLIGYANQSPPFRAVKVKALYLFIIGAALDLIAS